MEGDGYQPKIAEGDDGKPKGSPPIGGSAVDPGLSPEYATLNQLHGMLLSIQNEMIAMNARLTQVERNTQQAYWESLNASKNG